MKLHILATLASLIITAAPAVGWPTVYPTRTTVYVPELAHNGYTLFNPLDVEAKSESTLYLINMNGDVVHRWKLPFQALSGRLLPNGNLVAIGINPKKAPGRPGVGQLWIGGAAGWLAEVTWEGKRVFTHEDLYMHHDFAKLPNGHYLYLAWEPVPKALQAKVRGGIKGSEFRGRGMLNERLVEVNAQGRVVWEWHANAHLDPDVDIMGPFYKREEWLHLNSVAVARNGNIIVTSRNTDSLMVIDRRTGKILRRLGNTAYMDRETGRIEYRSGPNFIGGPHSGLEIPPGYEGAGNLLCYDNGLYYGGSRVVEFNPATGKLVWHSAQAGLGRRQFSWFLGSTQRLPNGNTLICDGANGRFYQETKRHELVWEYVSPYVRSALLQGAIFTAHHYAPDYCPQFKNLPAAKGVAITPPSNELLRVPPEQPTSNQQRQAEQQADLVPLPMALGVVAILASLLAFLLWKRRAQAK